eukprot:Pgem_evm1s7982
MQFFIVALSALLQTTFAKVQQETIVQPVDYQSICGLTKYNFNNQSLNDLNVLFACDLQASNPSNNTKFPNLAVVNNTNQTIQNVAFEIRSTGDNQLFNYKRPAMIIVPKSEAEVQRAVKIGNQNNLRVCGRSGGHGYLGYSNCDGGLMIDLRELDNISFSFKVEIYWETFIMF